jgi:hypothetical protein
LAHFGGELNVKELGTPWCNSVLIEPQNPVYGPDQFKPHPVNIKMGETEGTKVQ